MSPSALPPPPRSSRVAVVVYALCGAIGIAGLFAAIKDARNGEDVVVVEAAPVVVDNVDARLAVGVWRAGDDTIVLDANGQGSLCVAGAPRNFAWRIVGNDVVNAAGDVVATLDQTGQTPALRVGQLAFFPGLRSAVKPPQPTNGPTGTGGGAQ